ncbi:MAG: PhzF family phenazine biosynthesis protein [Spirochaetes bacterium]|nr:PhzF family phenazine biosynthesis protein [Spirochaetota bacterium]
MKLFGVDAFTEVPFRGNPACVCILDEERPDGWKQSVASEINLSETAFLRNRGASWGLRWFTPQVEVDLCGHATLASAHVLWETDIVKKTKVIAFETRSGSLGATKNGEWIELDFPQEPPQTAAACDKLMAALGIEALLVGKNRFDYIVEIDSEEKLKTLAPDFAMLKEVRTRGVIVTSRSAGGRYDFVSRFFAPAVGVNEDPVTGSSHYCLGPYWKEKTGLETLTAYQASSRGGLLKLRVSGGRVFISGKAVTVWRGEIE